MSWWSDFWNSWRSDTRGITSSVGTYNGTYYSDPLYGGDGSAKSVSIGPVTSLANGVTRDQYGHIITSPQNGGAVSGSAVSGSNASGRAIDYLNADLAKHYGMSGSTAYQEALSNTAYQRAVKDMQAAGLNPAVLMSGNGYAAGSSVYPSAYSARSYGAGSAGDSDNKLFGAGLYNLITLAGGALGYKISGNSSGYYIGTSSARTLMSALNGMFGGDS